MKKLNKFLACTFAAAIALSATHMQAVLVDAIALTNSLHPHPDNSIQLFGEAHIPHSANPEHLAEMDELIGRFDPKDVCLITEATKFPAHHEYSMCNELADICEKKKIEVHRIDFRKKIDLTTKEVFSFRRSPEKISVKEFIEAIEAQLTIIKTIIPEILEMDFIIELKKLWINPMFEGKQLKELFDYCKQQPSSHLLKYDNVNNFILNLVDTRMFAHAAITKKPYIFIVAGGYHTKRVLRKLNSLDHIKPLHAVCADTEENHTQLRLFMEKKLSVEELSKTFAAVNLKEYKSTLAKILAAKKDQSVSTGSSHDLHEHKEGSSSAVASAPVESTFAITPSQKTEK